jgi:PST family polysaccharide transporter
MDNVLVGRYLGARALGAYGLAYNVMYVPLTRISLPLMTVLSPAYARMQHDRERLQRSFLLSKRVINALLAPVFLASVVVAPDLVHVAFGARWNAAVVPLQLLSLAGLAQSLVSLHWSVLTALGKPGTLLRLNLLVTGLTISAFIAGLPFGIVGVAGCYAGARWLLVLADTRITTRAVSFPFWRTLRSGTEMLPFAIVMAAAGFGLRIALVHGHVPAVARLLAVALFMFVVYVGLVRLLVPSVLGEVKGALRGQH